MGHYISRNASVDIYGKGPKLSKDASWQAIYAAEAKSIGSYGSWAERNVYDAEECFATAVAIYIDSQKSLKTLAPSAYGYIENILNGYRNINPYNVHATASANN